MEHFPIAQVLPYGWSGVVAIVMFFGLRFVGRLSAEALEAFKTASREQTTAIREGAREQRDALQAMIAQMQITKDTLSNDIRESRHDARSAMMTAAAGAAEQIFLKVENLERLILFHFRELRDDLKLRDMPVLPPKEQPSRIG